jgi:rare lipoprotein A
MKLAQPYAGPPYQVEGKWYVPTYEPNYDEVGIASWYGPTFHGKASASGEQFDENAMTAAHPTLPIPSLVRVTNLENGKSIVVRLNDRGPFVDDRIIDLSKGAGAALGMHAKGTAKVRVQYVGPAPAAPNSLPASATAQQTEVSLPMSPQQPPQSSFVSQPLPPLVPPPAAPAPRAADLHGYFLQAGSFADLSNARALADKLQTVGPASVTSALVSGATYYRVMVGPWRTNVEALQAQDRLVEAGTKSILIAKLD